MSKPVLTAEQITIGYKQGKTRHVVAEDLSVSLFEGELVCLLGINGAGKSTLMRTLAGMQPALAGNISLDGQPLQTLRPEALARLVSLVLTERVDVGLLTSYELVSLGRHPYTDWLGRLSEDDHHAIESAIDAAGARELARRYVHQLSDGERQKVMIARALAQGSRFMLLDEPTAFLDLPRRVEIIHTLRHLAHTENRAVLLSTHDLDLALRTADRIWLLSNGGVLHIGAPEDLVISGVFADAFRNDGVFFNMESGSFSLPANDAYFIRVEGEGIEVGWTRRALERIGYNIVEDAPNHVTLIREGVRVRWTGVIDGKNYAWESLYEMAESLREN